MTESRSTPDAPSPVLPIHVAVHYMGCASDGPEGVRLGGNDGPLIDRLAEHVDRLTVLAYDPPAHPRDREDLVDFPVPPGRRNIHVLSLGPKGTRRDFLARRRRVRRLVTAHSQDWDVLFLRLVNRRAELVFGANLCPRVVATLGGTVSEFVRATTSPPLKKVVSRLNAYRSERTYRAIARSAGRFFVNGERLYEDFEGVAPNLRLLRSSSRRASDAFLVSDRLVGPEPRFLFVGAVTEAKGVFDMIEAFARIKRDLLPAAVLEVVGSGGALRQVQEDVRRRGLTAAVTFHGWLERDQVFRLMRAADVLFCLSRGQFESVPRVVHEAMAHSVLVVATRVAAVPFAFDDRRHLLLVDEGDVNGATGCVEELLTDPDLRKKILADAYDRARDMTLERVVASLVNELAKAWPELRGGE